MESFQGEFEDPCPHIFILSSALEEEGYGPILWMNSTKLENRVGRRLSSSMAEPAVRTESVSLYSSVLSPGEGVGSLRWDRHTAWALTLLAGQFET